MVDVEPGAESEKEQKRGVKSGKTSNSSSVQMLPVEAGKHGSDLHAPCTVTKRRFEIDA